MNRDGVFPLFIGANVIDLNDNSYKVNTCNGEYVINSKKLKEIITRYSSLDGKKTFNELVKEWNDESLIKNIFSFSQIGILVLLEKKVEDNSEIKELIYFNLYVNDAEPIREKIKNTIVYLYGENEFLQKVHRDIKEQGYSNIKPITNIESVDIDDENMFLIVTVYKSQEYALYDINKFCLENDIQWVAVVIDSDEVVIGPFIYPKETACYQCYKEIHERKKAEIHFNKYFLTSSIENIISGLLVQLMTETIIGFKNKTYWGKVLLYNLCSNNIKVKHVMKKSLCECYGKNPRLKRWAKE